ncbi:MAG: hypothetical protein IT580_06795 [Verrucomicrobiales bacterium]|nr:hypothetical protein [Verrucomicrobiales bacterium]
MSSNPNQKPAAEIRLGSLKAAIWKNDTEAGVRYNTSFCRFYRDGEQWKTSDYFGREDLLLLAKVADQAHTWIHAQLRENAPSSPTRPGNPSASPSPTPPTPGARSRGEGLR